MLEKTSSASTTRANVSMIESRARRKIRMARESLTAYQSTLTDHTLSVPKGTRMYDIPRAVLSEGDRFGIHLQSNLIDIVRMVKGARPSCLEDGRTVRKISFVFNQKGKVTLGKPS